MTTPYAYAKKCYSHGESPQLVVNAVGGVFLICDGDWNILETKGSFRTRLEALAEIEKTYNRTRKFIA